MSFAFSQAELDSMRADQEGHMMDTCVILTSEDGTLNEFNEADNPNDQESDVVACALDMRSSSERQNAQTTVIQYDATVRLPIGTVVKENSRIKILTRFGETLTPSLTYDIAAPIQRGPSGIRYALKKTVI